MNKIDDEDLGLDDVIKASAAEIENSKNKLFQEITANGSKYLNEIEVKNRKNEAKKLKDIKYILKQSKNYHTYEELISYSYFDVVNIRKELEKEKKSIFVDIFKFLNPSN